MSEPQLTVADMIPDNDRVVSILGHSSPSSDLVAKPISDRIYGLERIAWIKIGVIGSLFVALFWPNLRRLWDKTNPFYGEANWGHAICIPLIGLYYLYVNREQLLRPKEGPPRSRRGMALLTWVMFTLAIVLPFPLIYYEAHSILAIRPFQIPIVPALAGLLIVAALLQALLQPKSELLAISYQHSAGWFGGFILLFGIALFQYGIYPGQNDFTKDFGMVVTLFGVVLVLSGWQVMKIAWFPIAFLVCGIPWPGLVYSQLAGPLQHLAANVAVWTLQVTGVEASAGGTKIMIDGFHGVQRTLNVAEACAGLRSLMTFISVAAAVAFLSHRPLWQKLLVMLSAIPIAIFCNVMRVSGQGLLDHYVSQQLSESFAHQFVGLIMLIPAFLMILLVAWTLDQIFVEQIDRRHVVTAPKVISRGMVAAQVAAPPQTVPRSLASIRATTLPPKPADPLNRVSAPIKLSLNDGSTPRSLLNSPTPPRPRATGMTPARPGLQSVMPDAASVQGNGSVSNLKSAPSQSASMGQTADASIANATSDPAQTSPTVSKENPPVSSLTSSVSPKVSAPAAPILAPVVVAKPIRIPRPPQEAPQNFPQPAKPMQPASSTAKPPPSPSKPPTRLPPKQSGAKQEVTKQPVDKKPPAPMPTSLLAMPGKVASNSDKSVVIPASNSPAKSGPRPAPRPIPVSPEPSIMSPNLPAMAAAKDISARNPPRRSVSASLVSDSFPNQSAPKETSSTRANREARPTFPGDSQTAVRHTRVNVPSNGEPI